MLKPAAQPPCDYELQIVTSDRPNAGTSAKVFFNLFGYKGATGGSPCRNLCAHVLARAHACECPVRLTVPVISMIKAESPLEQRQAKAELKMTKAPLDASSIADT